ncbi:hypothetical protein GCM10010123_11760 [Pilimelia anulata]|uniref:Uncharacterized protein n=1 Tax=Pilimelia anulata TaxID=53371 RepID=A0A8J3F6W8_9ACTN|nr:DUF6232 family protein [Pilimelia anulata]GGJ83692.1 hypothetical protein GCM10010123_11760 [Pilimelia anulata]
MEREHYRDAAVAVTAAGIEIDGRHLPLAELTEVWYRRGARSWRRTARRGALALAILVPLALGATAVVIGLSLDLAPLPLAAVVGAALVAGLATGPLADLLLEWVDRSYSRGAREWEIWARWRGEEVLLLRTRDQRRFGQVYRAIERAAER